jgi:hypothetical protein
MPHSKNSGIPRPSAGALPPSSMAPRKRPVCGLRPPLRGPPAARCAGRGRALPCPFPLRRLPTPPNPRASCRRLPGHAVPAMLFAVAHNIAVGFARAALDLFRVQVASGGAQYPVLQTRLSPPRRGRAPTNTQVFDRACAPREAGAPIAPGGAIDTDARGRASQIPTARTPAEPRLYRALGRAKFRASPATQGRSQHPLAMRKVASASLHGGLPPSPDSPAGAGWLIDIRPVVWIRRRFEVFFGWLRGLYFLRTYPLSFHFFKCLFGWRSCGRLLFLDCLGTLISKDISNWFLHFLVRFLGWRSYCRLFLWEWSRCFFLGHLTFFGLNLVGTEVKLVKFFDDLDLRARRSTPPPGNPGGVFIFWGVRRNPRLGRELVTNKH